MTRENFLPYLADRVLNRPLMIHPRKAETILSVLEGRIVSGMAGGDETETEASRFIGDQRRGANGAPSLYRASGGTAIITIDGSLVNRGAWVGASSGLSSYEGIAAQIDQAADDPAIHAIVLDLNSFGGEASGMVTLASKIRALRKRKRVVAVVNDVAASAGYAIASSAHEIAISPTSLVGSIGIVMLHVDRSGEMQSRGLRPTIIHAGEKKADGNPFAPLPENVRADMQRDVMAMYDQFLKLVEAGRTKRRLSAEKARKTEADVYTGQGAIDAGLADRMATLDDILAELSRPVTSPGASQGTTTQARTVGATNMQAGPDPEEVKRKAEMLEQQERAAQAEARTQEARNGWKRAVADANQRRGYSAEPANNEQDDQTSEGSGDTTPDPKAKNGWSRAVEQANARRRGVQGSSEHAPAKEEVAGEQPSQKAVRTGWAKAAAEVNARH